jgi:uncharacterized protein (DUF58 family)
MNAVERFLDPALIERLNALQLSARNVVVGATTGSHRSPVKGASVEFRQHRFYVPGDEVRRLDWRVLGRTDRPYIKEYNEETNLRCMLMLDCSGSMAYGGTHGAKFDYAARLIAALAYLMLGQTESVGLAQLRRRVDLWLAPRGGNAQLSRLLSALERTTPGGPASVRGAVQDAANRLERRALVIVVSDFFSPPLELRDALARLKHDRHEIIALQVLDEDEVEFPFTRWSRFRGLEGEGAQLCEASLMRARYLERFGRHQRALADLFHSFRLEYRIFVTSNPLVEALTSFVATRARR